MFTGLIREIAEIKSYQGNFLSLKAKHQPNIGDSIAVNGACLSVVALFEGGFTVELSDETRKIIATENLKERAHIEPAMKLGERLEGHIVQGHIDTTGTIQKIARLQNSWDFIISIDPAFLKFVIPKGSIAVDGVSLTVNEVYKDSFRLTIIPHTIQNTLLKGYAAGRRVNIETDMFARYLYFLFQKEQNQEHLSWEKVDKIMALF